MNSPSDRLFDHTNNLLDKTPRQLLQDSLIDPNYSYSIGAFGAIAEFFHDHSDEYLVKDYDRLTLATNKGAIRLRLSDRIHPVAYQILSRRPASWQHGLAFCLPEHDIDYVASNTIEEIGEDNDAVVETDRDSILFEMGLGTSNVQFCIRTNDSILIDLLRKHRGQSILDTTNGLMGEIVKHSPHRVAVSPLGRIEVYQPISTDKTPQGPHTHVLPKLLKSGRTHAANIRLPKGLTPCFSLYPPHPLYNELGEPKAFAIEHMRFFEQMMALWGNEEFYAVKQQVESMVREGVEPDKFSVPRTRLGRTGARIAIRQLSHHVPVANVASRWLGVHDR